MDSRGIPNSSRAEKRSAFHRTEELAEAAVADLLNANADDFESAASRVLQKNREQYQRLAK